MTWNSVSPNSEFHVHPPIRLAYLLACQDVTTSRQDIETSERKTVIIVKYFLCDLIVEKVGQKQSQYQTPEYLAPRVADQLLQTRTIDVVSRPQFVNQIV